MSRIPQFKALYNVSDSKEEFQKWCDEMAKANLLFHLEDDPADICIYNTDLPLFTDKECRELRVIINTVFKYAKFDPMECALNSLNKILEERKES